MKWELLHILVLAEFAFGTLLMYKKIGGVSVRSLLRKNLYRTWNI
jgi:hypothetical protein